MQDFEWVCVAVRDKEVIGAFLSWDKSYNNKMQNKKVFIQNLACDTAALYYNFLFHITTFVIFASSCAFTYSLNCINIYLHILYIEIIIILFIYILIFIYSCFYHFNARHSQEQPVHSHLYILMFIPF